MTVKIEVNNLKKKYGSSVVLNNLSFKVKKGEIFGVLGCNGVGKTTLLECLEGFCPYEMGKIKVNGNMGIQLQTSSLPDYIKVKEAIQLFSKWNKMKVDNSVLSILGIDSFANNLYLELSTGQKRRLHLAIALLTSPDILFLDEPTAGLDVEGKRCLHEEIVRLKEQGMTIILASHDMLEIEKICTRIAILNNGKIEFLGTTDELANQVGNKYSVKITTSDYVIEFVTMDIGYDMLLTLKTCEEKELKIRDIAVRRVTLEEHLIELAKEVNK